jgi:hypothetical protein
MDDFPAEVKRMIVEMNRCARRSLLGEYALLTLEEVALITGHSLRYVAMQKRLRCLPPTIYLGHLVRIRLCDMRRRIQVMYQLPDGAMSNQDIPQIGDNERLTYAHLAVFLNCSVRMVAKLRKADRLPLPYRTYPTYWRPSDIRLWVTRRCRT